MLFPEPPPPLKIHPRHASLLLPSTTASIGLISPLSGIAMGAAHAAIAAHAFGKIMDHSFERLDADDRRRLRWRVMGHALGAASCMAASAAGTARMLWIAHRG